MHSFQHGRVVIATTPLANVSADALIVPRIAGPSRGDAIYDAILAAGGDTLAAAVDAEATATGGETLMTVEATGLRAERIIIVAVGTDAQEKPASLERCYESALHKAFESGALSIGLPLFLGGKDDDAASAVAIIAAFIEAHPSVEQITLATGDERATYRALAAAGEYL